MTDLSPLILRVRDKLSDVPIDWNDDSLVYSDIKDANEFIQMLVMDNVEQKFIDNCTVNLAAYYNYLTYTSLAERRMGEMPPTSIIKLDALRSKARSCLSLISKYPLLPDLSVDRSVTNVTPVGGKMRPSMI
jgi:hypothetical protein